MGFDRRRCLPVTAADCLDCGQPHSGKNNAKVCRRCYTSRRRKSQNLCDRCYDPITRNAKRCRHCSYPRHGVAKYRVAELPVAQVAPRPQLPEAVQDTLLAGRPWMRLEAERLARTGNQFVLARWR